MLKLTVTLLAVALAGTASAAGWRSLTIDGSSEAAFTKSVNEFKEKLPLARRYAFDWALQDIWIKGVQEAEASQSEYADDDFFKQLDGLGYEQVVTLVDPTGATEKARRREVNAWERPGRSGSDSMRTDLLRGRTTEYRPVTTGRDGQQERGRVP